ncbi:hypothetical protein C4K04_3622 [Pseudomonas chlororaphis]|uniref:Uncharacterized protein n=1 Tax=Pseudomonas chlororaphis TaxID=587753 RepID=A0A3G7TQB6_9PSED|nr:hypothetical protein C4K04_3622 [Pseudomonas chlororaphis]
MSDLTEHYPAPGRSNFDRENRLNALLRIRAFYRGLKSGQEGWVQFGFKQIDLLYCPLLLNPLGKFCIRTFRCRVLNNNH